ncbi:hypothetical protein FWK35_00031166, partial [Aphis craccivora]
MSFFRRKNKGTILILIITHANIIAILDSERSDECIDFTMLCVFFFCLYTRESVEIMLQFQTLGVVSDSKLNLVVLKIAGKNQKKIKEKWEFLLKTSFSTKSIFLYGCNSKTNHCKYLKFSLNVYIELNFQKFLTFFEPLKFLIFLRNLTFLRNLSKTRKFA